MKNLNVLLFLSLTILLFSCKKDKPLSHALAGQWELTTGVSGLDGVKTEYAPGLGNITKFTDTEYEIMRDGKTINKGTYSIISYKSLITKKEEKQIVYDGKANDVIKNYFTINDKKLIISVDAYDGPSSIFTKIN
ncbi:hypothetical protein [Pedobacter nutrimenti]|uniref:hypothetical protein n=1 Tax=Pedobacter nutrimenti TaxID=1241337 RepID=UPI002930A162|nr:hypothetical protein [Pedobacter nutrimenti]